MVGSLFTKKKDKSAVFSGQLRPDWGNNVWAATARVTKKRLAIKQLRIINVKERNDAIKIVSN